MHIFILTLFVLLGLSACSESTPPEAASALAVVDSASLQGLRGEETPEPEPQPDTVFLTAVGDVMLGTDWPHKGHLPPNGGKDLLKAVTPYLQDKGLTFGNLEGVIGKGGAAKKCNNPSVCYTFRMPGAYTQLLLDAGFDAVSIANNHANDFGSGGRKATAKTLTEAGLHFAGESSKPYTIFEHEGRTYGLLAAAPNSGCFNMRQYDKAVAYVKHLDTLCDIVLVSFHAGAEGSKAKHVPKRDEIFLGYNRGDVHKFAHMCIDAGADVLLGHGPHVTRAVELYKDRFITYSMGNFCTFDRFSLRGSKGIGPILKLALAEDGRFLTGSIIATKQKGRGVPVVDETGAVIQEVIDLTAADFPNTPLEVTSTGEILVKTVEKAAE